LLLGIWRNVEDLEASLNIHELRAIIDASREREHRQNKFNAALKGIDLDEGERKRNQDRLDAIQMRVNARLSGRSEHALESNDLGFTLETEE